MAGDSELIMRELGMSADGCESVHIVQLLRVIEPLLCALTRVSAGYEVIVLICPTSVRKWTVWNFSIMKIYAKLC